MYYGPLTCIVQIKCSLISTIGATCQYSVFQGAFLWTVCFYCVTYWLFCFKSTEKCQPSWENVDEALRQLWIRQRKRTHQTVSLLITTAWLEYHRMTHMYLTTGLRGQTSCVLGAYPVLSLIKCAQAVLIICLPLIIRPFSINRKEDFLCCTWSAILQDLHGLLGQWCVVFTTSSVTLASHANSYE